jgi:hypothetical protein
MTWDKVKWRFFMDVVMKDGVGNVLNGPNE